MTKSKESLDGCPQTKHADEEFVFGDYVTNIAASDNNPIKYGIFIRQLGSSSGDVEYATESGTHKTPLDNIAKVVVTGSKPLSITHTLNEIAIITDMLEPMDSAVNYIKWRMKIMIENLRNMEEFSTQKDISNTSTKPLDIGLIDSDTLIDCTKAYGEWCKDMHLCDTGFTSWGVGGKPTYAWLAFQAAWNHRHSEIPVIDPHENEELYTAKSERERGDYWKGKYFELEEKTRLKREIVEFDDVREILEPQCKLGGAWALWNALCAKFHIAKRNDIEGGSSNA